MRSLMSGKIATAMCAASRPSFRRQDSCPGRSRSIRISPTRLIPFSTSQQHGFRQSLSRSVIGSSPATAAGRASTIEATEILFLIRSSDAQNDDDGEALEELVNSLWSLQYAIPGGSVCGAGGAVVSKQRPPDAAMELDEEAMAAICAWSHIVHIRMSTLAAAKSFFHHPSVEKALQDATNCSNGIDCIMFESTLDNELGSIFRQGDGWDEGMEHLILFSPNDSYNGNAIADLPAMVSQLGDISESSRCGAVQSVQGKLEKSMSSISFCDEVLMSRFTQVEQLNSFTASPPHQAAWDGDSRLPGKVAVSLTFLIAPSDNQASTGISSNFL